MVAVTSLLTEGSDCTFRICSSREASRSSSVNLNFSLCKIGEEIVGLVLLEGEKVEIPAAAAAAAPSCCCFFSHSFHSSGLASFIASLANFTISKGVNAMTITVIKKFSWDLRVVEVFSFI